MPGARFCAECGSPMHLKVCANSGCGKVSDVSATVCASCGAPFPQIRLVEPGSLGSAAPAYAAASEKPRTSLWPLIAVAVVSGSLPLLWANREHLPAPKSGPFSTPDTTTPAPAVAAPVAPPATVAPVPPPAVPTAGAPSADPAAAAAPAKTEKKPPPRTPKSTVAQKSAKAPAKRAEPPPTCTEAVAALGLCDPKQVGK